MKAAPEKVVFGKFVMETDDYSHWKYRPKTNIL